MRKFQISLKVALASALKNAKIKDFRFHDLRHTYTTNARKAGVHETVIMKLTGHKTRSMFTRYNSVDEADAREALNLMEGYFGISGQPTTASVLHRPKKGLGHSPNPLNLLAPRAGLGHYGRNILFLPASPSLRIPSSSHLVGGILASSPANEKSANKKGPY